MKTTNPTGALNTAIMSENSPSNDKIDILDQKDIVKEEKQVVEEAK